MVGESQRDKKRGAEKVFSVVVERGELGKPKCNLIRHANCR